VIEPVKLPYAGITEHAIPLGKGMYLSVTAQAKTKLLLDNLTFKDVIFFNSKIVFHGAGPVVLQNVQFVNCTFEIERSSPWTKFADAVMAVGPTNYGS
jgi:hypothetical protein